MKTNDRIKALNKAREDDWPPSGRHQSCVMGFMFPLKRFHAFHVIVIQASDITFAETLIAEIVGIPSIVLRLSPRVIHVLFVMQSRIRHAQPVMRIQTCERLRFGKYGSCISLSSASARLSYAQAVYMRDLSPPTLTVP